MPQRAKRPCRRPGCPALVSSGFCDEHRAAAARTRNRAIDERRPSAAARGYDREWREAREAYLAEHPLCECDECKAGNHVLAATVVDHVTPHRGDMDLFWDVTNWCAMSKPCHDRKTAVEDGGWRTAQRGRWAPRGA